MRAGRKATLVQRGDRQRTRPGREANAISTIGIEIGMRAKERARLPRRRIAEAGGIMMAVALGMRETEQRAERGTHVGCIAGALSRTEYLDGLAAAGFVDATVDFTHEAVPGLHGAIVRATKPA